MHGQGAPDLLMHSISRSMLRGLHPVELLKAIRHWALGMYSIDCLLELAPCRCLKVRWQLRSACKYRPGCQ